MFVVVLCDPDRGLANWTPRFNRDICNGSWPGPGGGRELRHEMGLGRMCGILRQHAGGQSSMPSPKRAPMLAKESHCRAECA